MGRMELRALELVGRNTAGGTMKRMDTLERAHQQERLFKKWKKLGETIQFTGP